MSFLELLNNECSTFSFALGGVNVAEALVSKGLATCVRYSADNDQRSSKYDDLLAAEDKALKSNKGKATNEQILTERKTSLNHKGRTTLTVYNLLISLLNFRIACQKRADITTNR